MVPLVQKEVDLCITSGAADATTPSPTATAGGWGYPGGTYSPGPYYGSGVVEQLLKVVLVDQILLVLVVMEQHIPFWDPLILGLEVEEVETNVELWCWWHWWWRRWWIKSWWYWAVLGALVIGHCEAGSATNPGPGSYGKGGAGGANTGGGGGGMAVSVGRGGAGGSGIVVIAYPV